MKALDAIVVVKTLGKAFEKAKTAGVPLIWVSSSITHTLNLISASLSAALDFSPRLGSPPPLPKLKRYHHARYGNIINPRFALWG